MKHCSIVFLLVFFFFNPRLCADEGILEGIDVSSDVRYAVRLEDGSFLIGVLSEKVESEKEGTGVKIKTAIGTATVYESQIAEIIPMDDLYRHAHRVFLLPTGEAIRKNHFVGNLELFGLWAGIGVGDVVSITAGRTALPSVPSGDQVSFVNLKATIYDEEYTTMPGKFSLAGGVNLGWLNAPNRLTHAYFSATFTRIRSRVTGTVFMNLSGNSMELFTARAGTLGSVVVHYPASAIGIGVGVDTRLPGRQDLHVLAELWNSDISKPTNTVLMLGLRLANTAVSMDFGLAVFSVPSVVPVMSFAWTPF